MLLHPQVMLKQVVFIKDNYLNDHHSNVARYVDLIATEIFPEIRDLAVYAASFHDIGKIGIPDRVLFKPGPLAVGEWDLIHQHPVVGSELIERGHQDSLNGVLPVIVKAIRHHHERWDGKGYPDGLTGEVIPLAARIIAVADAFDAMITDRPYKNTLTQDDALREIVRCAGSQFDPGVVNVFQKNLKEEGAIVRTPGQGPTG